MTVADRRRAGRGVGGAARPGRGRDRGVTLVETLVAVAVLGVVVAAALDALLAFSAAERDQARAVRARDDVRLAVREVGRDIQRAGRLQAPSDPATADSSLTLVLDGQTVRWRAQGGMVVRETLSGTTVTGTRTVLRDSVHPGGAPTFTYLDAAGTVLTAASVGGDVLAACSTRVRVVLATMPAGSAGPFTASAELALRDVDTTTGCVPAAASPPSGTPWGAAVQGLAPLAWWRLGETTGTVATNLGTGGAALSGTWGSGVERGVTGMTPADAAARFPGGSPSPVVTLGDPLPSFSAGDGLTVAAWVRSDAVQVIGEATVIRRGSGLGGLALAVRADGGVDARVSVAGGSTVAVSAPAGSVRSGAWTFLALTYDRSTVSVFVNGVLAGSAPGTGSIDTGGDGTVTIGAAAAGSSPFVGVVDEVAVWRRALTGHELAQLFRAGG